MINAIKHHSKNNPTLKKRMLRFVMHPIKARPNWWIRIFYFLYIKKGKKSVIYRSVRMDTPPFNKFTIGDYSVIEDYSCINNAVGDIRIGNQSRIGLSNTIIGPVEIGNHVHIGQNVVISGLNHNYSNVDMLIDEQGINTSLIKIEDDVWIGANSVITAGVHIGNHCVIAAGSVVRGEIPAYTVCAGIPAKIIKKYDFDNNMWVKA